MVAATLGWASLASCVEGATSTPSEQMACCKKGHDMCPMRGSPEDCCKKAPQLNQVTQCTAVEKFTSPTPHLFALHVLDPLLVSATVVWSPMLVAYDSSPPPRSKHPTYLVLSTFRI
jgi:hypothetical protein